MKVTETSPNRVFWGKKIGWQELQCSMKWTEKQPYELKSNWAAKKQIPYNKHIHLRQEDRINTSIFMTRETF